MWIAQATHKEEGSAVPSAKFAAIHEAALEACDARDGVKDGVIDEPRKCNFDPKTIECKGADEPTCLTSAQVDTVRTIYSDVTNPRTKQVIFQRHEPGSEMGWNTMAGTNPMGLGLDLYKYVVYQDSNWDYKTLNFDADVDHAYKVDSAMDATNPDLSGFMARGGKLIQYHGWADPQISPGTSVAYYQSVVEKMGPAKVQQNYRLFMVPGMAHCGGGDGTSTLRHAGGDGAVGGTGESSRPDRSRARAQWADGPDASAVRVSAGGELQGVGEHGRLGQLRLQVGSRLFRR